MFFFFCELMFGDSFRVVGKVRVDSERIEVIVKGGYWSLNCSYFNVLIRFVIEICDNMKLGRMRVWLFWLCNMLEIGLYMFE